MKTTAKEANKRNSITNESLIQKMRQVSSGVTVRYDHLGKLFH